MMSIAYKEYVGPISSVQDLLLIACSFSILASTTFQFTVGPKQCIYHIHTCLACHISPVFSRLIAGSWKETREGEVILDDIDEETFIRFCEYAYCGDYAVPSLEPVAEPHKSNVRRSSRDDNQGKYCSDQQTTKPAIEEFRLKQTKIDEVATLPRIVEGITVNCFKHLDNESLFSALKRRCRGAFTREPSHASLRPIHVRNLPPASKLARLRQEFRRASRGDSNFQPPRNTHPEQSMREILLCHARTYVFADRYDCPDLRNLVLVRLRMTLAGFMVFTERVEDILVVVMYIYNNTSERDGIRVLLVDFGLCIAPTLAEHPLWKEFADTVPDYVDELHRRLKEILGFHRVSSVRNGST